LKKLRDKYISRYLISKHEPYSKLYLMNLSIKINFLLNQMIIETDTHIKFIEKNKRKKLLCKAAHIRNII
jgi:hypothetical protein